MSVDHRVQLTPDERAEIVAEARRRTSYVRAVGVALRDGEEPTPLPGKTWIRRSNDCAIVVACLAVILLYAVGLPKVVAVGAGLAVGVLGGWVYYHSPRIASRLSSRI